MWLLLSLFAMVLLVARRSTEKSLSDRIPSSILAWLQQVLALPFLIAMLPLAEWFNLFSLSSEFKILLVLITMMYSIDLIIYYKAIQIGDLSIITPLLSLSSVSGIVASYIFLDQKPSPVGILAAILIIIGSFLVVRHRNKLLSKATNNTLAVLMVLFIIIFRGAYSPIEVTMMRETNPIYVNFITSLFTAPAILAILLVRQRKTKIIYFSKSLLKTVLKHRVAVIFIGASMALNIYFTLTAKTIAPNAGYVTAIKGAQVVPITLIGVFIFKEHVSIKQWFGICTIVVGLALFLIA
jgi:transporter family protein